MNPRIVVTSGEPAGIGPDLCVMLAQTPRAERVVVIGNRELLAQRADALKVPYRAVSADEEACAAPGVVAVVDVELAHPVVAGKLDPANAAYVMRTLEVAIDGCLSGRFDAMVTAPVHKGVINDSGVPFTGHTEFLAARTQTPHVVMMLVGGGLRVALATTHVAVKDIAREITPVSLERTLRVLHRELITRFGIRSPRIAVAGLNPHAGESGHLGREEIEIIEPIVTRLRNEGMCLAGPLPADTIFNPAQLRDFDCVLAMYHDQGLPVLKFASFGSGVNITLGLPLIRTSVDHGTALDVAGTGKADPGSLYAAIEVAATLAARKV